MTPKDIGAKIRRLTKNFHQGVLGQREYRMAVWETALQAQFDGILPITNWANRWNVL